MAVGETQEGQGGGGATYCEAGKGDARVFRGTVYCHTAAGRRGEAMH